ncbi:unnamed protein product (macronuclear) [Paramecium tetraurelia]|uniref:PHD-type domain-containing protein n=1 Tax=Paramecium tetraurelia TaxID=5888 RepID=A0BPK3_PARTE|nr:uncharacterized protein GSPATT00005219001 [Paramecium tetraurelia]CAK60470.1 unnamed protein product [Paramecium tetraurelia]|eukprot:XP_001427868.1 hypothetical protein (macronuclear) [Paramecium tetraurelia strain d4-2]
MSEPNIHQETNQKLNEIFNSIKLENVKTQEAFKKISNTNNLVTQVKRCQSLTLLLQNIQSLNQAQKEFKEIKINNLCIKLNSDVVIYTKKNGHRIAKAVQIIGVARFQQYTPIIQVQWYYAKKDLKLIIGQYWDGISQRELFLSDQYDYIQPDIIVGEAQVLELEQFKQKNLSTGFVFFCRSFYKNSQIIPPIQKWEKHCKCRQPMNPDRLSVICDICQLWFHKECIPLNNNVQGIYVCPSCKKKK